MVASTHYPELEHKMRHAPGYAFLLPDIFVVVLFTTLTM
ncbi:hypothetical protein ECSTECB2F1_5007 [Escherichia coli O91:H21 str. B2F1]|nr:hypothetical protein ECSTECB2F1_5007 [Escherichia coli O91:H21 str. B2F1]